MFRININYDICHQINLSIRSNAYLITETLTKLSNRSFNASAPELCSIRNIKSLNRFKKVLGLFFKYWYIFFNVSIIFMVNFLFAIF